LSETCGHEAVVASPHHERRDLDARGLRFDRPRVSRGPQRRERALARRRIVERVVVAVDAFERIRCLVRQHLVAKERSKHRASPELLEHEATDHRQQRDTQPQIDRCIEAHRVDEHET
jgi:hypothetical protein